MRTYTLTTMLSCYINTALLLNNSELSGCHPHFIAPTPLQMTPQKSAPSGRRQTASADAKSALSTRHHDRNTSDCTGMLGSSRIHLPPHCSSSLHILIVATAFWTAFTCTGKLHAPNLRSYLRCTTPARFPP